MTALAKFLAKNGADFLPPRAAALVEERIAALRAVREVVAGKANYVGKGNSAHAYETGATLEKAGDKIVKVPRGTRKFDYPEDKFKIQKQFKRRGFLESVLADKELAPRTMLVETSRNKYLVQPKWDDTDGIEDLINYDAHPDLGRWAKKQATKAGMTNRDLSYHNVGYFNGKPGIFDAGEEYLERAMTPAERASALEKFISKGKRKKPWLDE